MICPTWGAASELTTAKLPPSGRSPAKLRSAGEGAAGRQFACGAVKQATLKLYPEGDAKDTGAYKAALCSDIQFKKIAEAFVIHAEIHRPDHRFRRVRSLHRYRARRSRRSVGRP
jgi:hypothetical protein